LRFKFEKNDKSTAMKTLLLILIFMWVGLITAIAQEAKTKPPETAKGERVKEVPQKPPTPEVKSVNVKKPEVVQGAKPQKGAKPKVVRPDKRRPAGAGRPTGVRRPPVRRLR
jgi:hypothetical protein